MAAKRLRCPNCGIVLSVPQGQWPVCPNCAFGSVEGPGVRSAPPVALQPGNAPTAGPGLCRQCGKEDFTLVKRGYSWGYGAAGGVTGIGLGAAVGYPIGGPCLGWLGPVLVGPLGAMAGGVGANEMVRLCTTCGAKQ